MDNKELPWKRFYTLDPQVFPPGNGDWDGTAAIRDRNVNPGGRLLQQGEVTPTLSPTRRPAGFLINGRFGKVDMVALQRQPVTLSLLRGRSPLRRSVVLPRLRNTNRHKYQTQGDTRAKCILV